MDIKNRFIILRKTRYSEADLIIQALSPLGEKVSFIARSALKSKKRFGGGILEPGNFVILTYKPGVRGGMGTLKEASVINDFMGLRSDYDRLEFALKAIDVVGKVSQEGDVNSEFLFNLTGHLLKCLSEAENIKPIQLQFWLKFLLQQGVLTIEPWMEVFLREPLGGHSQLTHQAEKEFKRMIGLEMMVSDYIKNAGL